MATAPLTQTTGRRKEAIARTRLRPGTGVLTVNGRPFDTYFTTPAHRMEAIEPLTVLEVTEQYDVDTTIHGGGVSGQAGDAHGARPLARRGQPREPLHAEARRPPHVTRARRSPRSTAWSRPARPSSSPSADRRVCRAGPAGRGAVSQMKFEPTGSAASPTSTSRQPLPSTSVAAARTRWLRRGRRW